jgi:glycosyltransferase involved in cell wall biosynthesis
VTAPLRLALIASNRFAIAQPFAGGLEAHVWHLARSLADLGHRVALFAAPGSDPDLGCAGLAVRELALSDAAQADPSMSPLSFMADHHAYLALMMQLAEPGGAPFDVIHNHSLHHLPVAMAPLLRAPMLTTVHTPPTPWLESALQLTGGAVTRLAAVSRHTARAWRPVAGEIAVVPNGVDSRRWPLGPGGAGLVWFGRFTPEKAPHLAVEAALRANRPLVLAGPLSDPVYFADRIAPRLGDEVRYAGHLDQHALARLVGGSAAALVTPTWDEPYGLVIAEAMSCGTPVVAFACGGIPEIVAAQGGRLVPPGDVHAMAAAVPAAVALPRVGVHRHAIAHCSASAMVARYLTIYHDMIEHGSDGAHDRLLHSPPRPRTPQSSHQHLRAAAPPGYRADVTERPRSAPVRRSPQATA